MQELPERRTCQKDCRKVCSQLDGLLLYVWWYISWSYYLVAYDVLWSRPDVVRISFGSRPKSPHTYFVKRRNSFPSLFFPPLPFPSLAFPSFPPRMTLTCSCRHWYLRWYNLSPQTPWFAQRQTTRSVTRGFVATLRVWSRFCVYGIRVWFRVCLFRGV